MLTYALYQVACGNNISTPYQTRFSENHRYYFSLCFSDHFYLFIVDTTSKEAKDWPLVRFTQLDGFGSTKELCFTSVQVVARNVKVEFDDKQPLAISTVIQAFMRSLYRRTFDDDIEILPIQFIPTKGQAKQNDIVSCGWAVCDYILHDLSLACKSGVHRYKKQSLLFNVAKDLQERMKKLRYVYFLCANFLGMISCILL